MCTTGKFLKNLIENSEIKEEPEVFDTITFEDYKFTENNQISRIKEEPVDYYFEVVENFETKNFDENSLEIIIEKIDLNEIKIEKQDDNCGENWTKSSPKSFENLVFKSSHKVFENSPQDHYNPPQDLKTPQNTHSDSQITAKLDEYSPQLHQKPSKYKPIVSKLPTKSGESSKNFDENFGFKNEHTIVNLQKYSPKMHKILINHDHNYSERNNFSELNQFYGEYNNRDDESDENGENSDGICVNNDDDVNDIDDEYVSGDDDNSNDYSDDCQIVEKPSKFPPNFNKLIKLNTRKISNSSLESSDKSESQSSNSESEESLDEDEDGIQYKEVPVDEINFFGMKKRKFSERSVDDHSCYTKNQKIARDAQRSEFRNNVNFKRKIEKFGLKACDSEFKDPNSMPNSPRGCKVLSNNEKSHYEDLTAKESKLTTRNFEFVVSIPNFTTKASKFTTNDSSEFATKISKLTTKAHNLTTSQHKASNSTTNESSLPQTLPLKCPDCPMTFNDTLRLNRHKRLHVLPQHQCRNCLKKFKRESMLKKHFCDIKCQTCVDTCTCRMETSNDCIICQNINFRYFADYKQHMVSQHNEIVTCKICEKNNFTFFKHKQHGHEIQKSFRCTECTSVLKSREQLQYHMEIHAKNFSCKKCGKVFSRRYLLRQHELTHENPKYFYCEICDKNFQRKFCLENHKKVIHGDKEKEEKYLKLQREMYGDRSVGWISCDKCPALFRNKQSHQRHIGQAHVGFNTIVVK